jgi:hypothetical protein
MIDLRMINIMTLLFFPENGVLRNFDFESTPSARRMRLRRRHHAVTGGGITLPRVAELIATSSEGSRHPLLRLRCTCNMEFSEIDGKIDRGSYFRRGGIRHEKFSDWLDNEYSKLISRVVRAA